jgi:hypothetical protein
VGVVQPAQHLGDHVQGLGGRQAAAVGQAPQPLHVDALDELHREKEFICLGAPEVEHLHDVRVRQLHRQPDLVEEPRHELRVAARFGADALQRNALRHACLGHRAGSDDLRHPALGDQTADVVAPDQLRHAIDYISAAGRPSAARAAEDQ